jgi:hypothetical protein
MVIHYENLSTNGSFRTFYVQSSSYHYTFSILLCPIGLISSKIVSYHFDFWLRAILLHHPLNLD